jgi:hypothetical protein
MERFPQTRIRASPAAKLPIQEENFPQFPIELIYAIGP